MTVWADRVAATLVADDGSHDPRQVTASAIGGCLRAAAWRLADVPFTDDSPRHPSASLGRAIHDHVTTAIAAEYGIDAEDVREGVDQAGPVAIEQDVTYAYRDHAWGGRLDLYDRKAGYAGAGAYEGTGELIDVKTCGDFAWSRAKAGVVTRTHIMQALHYGVSLESQGWIVTRIRWIYVNRESGEVFELFVEWNGPEMRQALHDRLDAILAGYAAAVNGEAESVEREGEGIVTRGFSECNACPFRSRCWGKGDDWEPVTPEHEQAARIAGVARSYVEAREAEKAAAGRKARAGAQLRHAGARGRFGDWNVDATGKALQVRAATSKAPE